MRNVLAILRKDVRRLRLEVLAFWLLLAITEVVEPFGVYWRDGDPLRVSTVALLACCYLITAAIHQETLPGDRQYWLTRPFTRRQLLLEKALFIASCVVLPVLLALTASLAILRIPPLQFAGALLWHMVVFTAVIVLPVTALAAVTRGIAQFLLAAFLVIAILLVLNLLFDSPISAGPWIGAGPAYVLLTLAGVVLVSLQYAARATTVNRLMFGAIVVLFFFAFKTELDDAVSATVRITLAPSPPHKPFPPRAFDIISIPIHFDGVPANAEALMGTVHLSVNGSHSSENVSIRDFTAGNGRLTFPVMPEKMSAPMQVTGSLNMTLFERQREIRAPRDYEYLQVPGVGVCTRRQEEASRPVVICLTPAPSTAVALQIRHGLQWVIPPGIGSAFVDFTLPLQPVVRFVGYPAGIQGGNAGFDSTGMADAQSLVIVRTIANLRGEFHFPNIRLADYRVSE
jgi:hypothetical protein